MLLLYYINIKFVNIYRRTSCYIPHIYKNILACTFRLIKLYHLYTCLFSTSKWCFGSVSVPEMGQKCTLFLDGGLRKSVLVEDLGNNRQILRHAGWLNGAWRLVRSKWSSDSRHNRGMCLCTGSPLNQVQWLVVPLDIYFNVIILSPPAKRQQSFSNADLSIVVVNFKEG